ncbi:helix-turn-helix domain-containing protein [Ferruginibacter albus]|uniref:helix-turn-helix domain-containing protein n=1 Tax=Ferruginibacter albus TaxID=2875540 RepID=UPI001CC6DD22|nr:helix-turn-helix domain-containing protein [Ferruginibacter albus]UAY53180.1 helix-turn-helix domain-containing protein [Ferruginibacter albus]
MEVICLQEPAFYALIEEVYERLKIKEQLKEDKWITDEQAMALLNIKSKTTMQKLRDEGKLRYSHPQKKTILYDRNSINEYLEKNARETF